MYVYLQASDFDINKQLDASAYCLYIVAFECLSGCCCCRIQLDMLY
eukprot:UN01784